MSENNFKFGLYQNEKLIAEKIFSADDFNPNTRYSVNIKSMIPSIVSNLQGVLSSRDKALEFEYFGYNFLIYHNKQISLYPKEIKDELRRTPKESEQYINGKKLTGVRFKFGLYINENTIVERFFYVNNYNPNSLQSINIYTIIEYIVYDIKEMLIKIDQKHLWEDNDLINKCNLPIHVIRELHPKRREELLRRIYK